MQLKSLAFAGGKFALAALLLKFAANEGGVDGIDAFALASAHIGIVSVASLPWLTACRRSLGGRKAVRLAQCLSYMRPSVLSSLAVGGIWLLMGVLLIPDVIPSGRNFQIYSLALLTGCIASALVGIEYIAGRYRLQNSMRQLDFIVFLVLAIVCIFSGSGLLALNAGVWSLLAARFLIGVSVAFELRRKKNRDIRSNPSPEKLVLSAFCEPMYSFFRIGAWKSAFANAFQSGSSVLLYSYAYGNLPAGSLALILISYRFAGPMQVAAGQISYSTWNGRDIRTGVSKMLIFFIFSVALSFFVPLFMGDYLGLDVEPFAWVISLAACAHLLLQGACQISGSVYYASGEYQKILLSSAPHLLVTVVGVAIAQQTQFFNVGFFMSLLILSSFVEWLILRFYYSTPQKSGLIFGT